MNQPGAMTQWGPNEMRFDSADDLEAFARELGCASVSYFPTWNTRAVMG